MRWVKIEAMPRQTISEFRAKKLLAKVLDIEYPGLSIDTDQSLASQLKDLTSDTGYAIKVDQAVKGRHNKDLLVLNVPASQVRASLEQLARRSGYRYFLVEPMIPHARNDEHYLCLTRETDVPKLYWREDGGTSVELAGSNLAGTELDEAVNWAALAHKTGLSASFLKRLAKLFQENHMTFLEINPYIVLGKKFHALDLAIEVDSAAQHFVNDWSEADFRSPKSHLTRQEHEVSKLAKKSQASFALTVLNPDGAIFLLLSGGGASVVIADEIYNLGFGTQIANYGEYSGNPTAEETYIYTKALLQLLLNSKAPEKVLFIGGAVANFTNVAQTFQGIIRALEELGTELRSQGLRVYVRRGGPSEEEGLSVMRTTLQSLDILGAVHDASVSLAAATSELTRALR